MPHAVSKKRKIQASDPEASKSQEDSKLMVIAAASVGKVLLTILVLVLLAIATTASRYFTTKGRRQ